MTRRDAFGRIAVVLTMGCCCFVSGGATCSRGGVNIAQFPPPPPVLRPAASLEEVVSAVNRTSAVRELSTNTASVDVLSMPAVPTLSATLALRRDREFRLRASLPIVMSSGLDLGSNRDVFWFEVPEGMSRTLFFARHDEYERRLNRAILPVDPSWVIDALGLIQVDASQVVAGPVLRPDGKLEIRTAQPTPAGLFQRVCYIDAAAGHVTDQLLYAPNGQLVAESHASNHLYDSSVGCSLPHALEIKLTPSSDPPLHLRIDIGQYAINQILSGDPNLFVLPQSAANVVDLSKLSPAPMASQVNPNVFTPASHRISSPTQYRETQSTALPMRGTITP